MKTNIISYEQGVYDIALKIAQSIVESKDIQYPYNFNFANKEITIMSCELGMLQLKIKDQNKYN